jgi:osmotically-inducible protein OsmY
VDDGLITVAAEKDARNTVGVLMVRNHLQVRPTFDLADEEITQRVERAMRRDPLVNPFDVGVTTFDGEVYLAGEVDSWIERIHAEQVAARVQGVVDIHNNLDVSRSRGFVSDRAIREEIEGELLWSPFVDSDEVHVTVDNGVATLTGTVDTWADYSWAAENAREGGALRVRNNLKVRNEQGAYWMPF